MKTSIVIPVLNQLRVTQDCIRALKANTPREAYELIVVDNASCEPTATWLRQQHFDKLIRNEKNTGFGNAVNRGWQEATGDVLCTINSDTIPGPGWLETLTDTLLDNRVGLTGAFGGFCHPDWQCARIERDYPREVDYIEGSCLLMRRDAHKAIGGFSKAYEPAYCEDTDLSIRAHRKGYRVFCRPDVDFKHLGGQTSAQELPNLPKVLQEHLRILGQLYGPCESVYHDNPPVTLVVERGAFVDAWLPIASAIAQPKRIHWESVRTTPGDTGWHLVLKCGERVSPAFAARIADLCVPQIEAWMVPTPNGEEPRLFQADKAAWDAEKRVVLTTLSGQAQRYKGEGIV